MKFIIDEFEKIFFQNLEDENVLYYFGETTNGLGFRSCYIQNLFIIVVR
jgi:hypothetical protein